MTRANNTLCQLPRDAETYYEESIGTGLYDYIYTGTDSLGRKVYQKYLCGEATGEPRALLTFREYTRKVKEWAQLSPAMGVQRWTQPTF